MKDGIFESKVVLGLYNFEYNFLGVCLKLTLEKCAPKNVRLRHFLLNNL